MLILVISAIQYVFAFFSRGSGVSASFLTTHPFNSGILLCFCFYSQLSLHNILWLLAVNVTHSVADTACSHSHAVIDHLTVFWSRSMAVAAAAAAGVCRRRRVPEVIGPATTPILFPVPLPADLRGPAWTRRGSVWIL